MLKKKQTILAKTRHNNSYTFEAIQAFIFGDDYTCVQATKKMDIQQFWIRYDTHMLLQQLLSVWTQPSEIATDPFPIQQGIKGGLESCVRLNRRSVSLR